MRIVVVGAGVIGCACARELARGGADVTVFDARTIGRGASWASAGVLAPDIEGHDDPALRMLGRRSLDLYDRLIQELNDEGQVPLPYARGGTVEVALDADHAARLRRAAEQSIANRISARWLDSDEVRSVEPLIATNAIGGLLVETHGFVGVPELCASLAASAMRAGARFGHGTRVTRVSPRPDGGCVVATTNEAITADFVVLAAGSWAGTLDLAGAPPVPVTPVRGQLLHLAWPTDQPLRHIVWGADCYIVPWLNGRVLVGATVEDVGFDERATVAGVRDLLAAGCALVPSLSQASFLEVRVGLRPASPDGLPIIGQAHDAPGLIYATGHYRNGVLLAPLTALLVKQLISGEPGDLALLDAVDPSRLSLQPPKRDSPLYNPATAPVARRQPRKLDGDVDHG